MPRLRAATMNQEKIVFGIAVLLFVLCAATLNGFLTPGNLIALVRGVSVLGILGIGMGMVIIGRGIDLSAVAIMAMSVAWFFALLNHSIVLPEALALALAGVVLIGALNGVLIAYGDVSPLFATLATGAIVYGFGRSVLIDQDSVGLPAAQTAIRAIGQARLGPIPIETVLFAAIAVLAFLVMRYTRFGRFIYLMGDNYDTARNMGIPVRTTIVLQYVVSALIAFIAGAITAANLLSMNIRIINSTLLYDIILVVVIGGISLSGGRGGIRNIVVGTLLIGILSNGMTILDLSNVYQNLTKAVVLLIAITIDSVLNPRDEQTDKQGDI